VLEHDVIAWSSAFLEALSAARASRP